MTAAETHSTAIVRPVQASDLSALVEMNNQSVPAVSPLTLAELKELVTSALACLVAEIDGTPAGLLLCLKEGTSSYKSPNYAWVSANRSTFAYIDRIFIADSARGQRAGEALYQALFELPETQGRPFVCEVNSRPANPGSMRFHKRLGFTEIGEMDHGDKAVVFLERAANSTGSPS
ncbi:GNAT family N-acetyltransferase [Roseibium sp.]|uniref:GNAT family N-acetyltransferase n=1 Tax=Roseibium sp. TaxID=1936156 RepID=UPI003A97D683